MILDTWTIIKIEIIIHITIILVIELTLCNNVSEFGNSWYNLSHIDKYSSCLILLCTLYMHKFEQSRWHKNHHHRQKKPPNHMPNWIPSCFYLLVIPLRKDKKENRSKKRVHTSSQNNEHQPSKDIEYHLFKTSDLIHGHHRFQGEKGIKSLTLELFYIISTTNKIQYLFFLLINSNIRQRFLI